MRLSRILVLALVVFAAACQGPLPRDPALASQVTPQQLAGGAHTEKGSLLTWGGSLRSLRNLADSTRLEVLAYPLNTERRPLTDEPSQGRFMVDMPGFLEPQELPPGTLVTVQGRYQRTLDGRVGEASYRFPLLQDGKLDVWEPETASVPFQRPDVRWNLGIGTWGSGVGVGIGF